MKATIIRRHHARYVALPSVVQQTGSWFAFVNWLESKRRKLAALSAERYENHTIDAMIADRRFDLEAKLHQTRIF